MYTKKGDIVKINHPKGTFALYLILSSREIILQQNNNIIIQCIVLHGQQKLTNHSYPPHKTTKQSPLFYTNINFETGRVVFILLAYNNVNNCNKKIKMIK